MSETDAQRALISLMLISSAADGDMSEVEWRRIHHLIQMMPVFEGFAAERVGEIAESVAALLSRDDGLEQALDEATRALPRALHETAYALAIDVCAADGAATQEELEFLTEIRYAFDIGRLHASAIEHAARVRHRAFDPPQAGTNNTL